ncbi:efflux RND transporter periplasmic adaptor subunit [Lachnospiraceae bacterium 29-84]
MSKKKVGIIAVAVIVIAAAVGGGAFYFLKGNIGIGDSADKVYVETIASLTSANAGNQNRYSGVVEAQETWGVNKDAEREIKERFVEEGDMVEEGTPLFEYDMEEAKAELSQAQLDLEGMQNDITSAQRQIEQLTRERNSVSQDERFEYTAKIQETENSIKQTEYNIESKKAEMEKKQESIDNAVVTSKLAGVVKSINETGMDMMGETAAYITVLAVGDFRVKGTVSELNMQFISEGQQVLMRSRIDEEQVWTGSISKIETQPQEENNNGVYYASDSGDGGEKAAKYPFYITLDSTEGLMLGQHVFIELEVGQTEEKEGIWLHESYIVMEEEKPYVWAADSSSRLEKRVVELGEYDEALGEYQIVSGLTEEDAIASPMSGLYEGVTAVTDASEIDYDSPLYNPEGEEGEEGLEEGMEEGVSDGMEGTEGAIDGMEGSEGTMDEVIDETDGASDSGDGEMLDGDMLMDNAVPIG